MSLGIQLPLEDRVIVALDVSSKEAAMERIQQLGPNLRFVKVGMELFYSTGPSLISYLKDQGLKVFLDLKVHDIPNTAHRAIAVLSKLGCDMLNVHCAGGKDMMVQAKQALVGESLLLGVTQLTSTGQATLNEEIGIPGEVQDAVLRYASLAKQAGLAGVVCSPQEVTLLKQSLGQGFITVTPGVRPAGGNLQDQKRVMTPAQAIKVGADYLVIGRPITAQPNPRRALEEILTGMEAGV